MANSRKTALTEANLSMIGAVDDFYEAYRFCISASETDQIVWKAVREGSSQWIEIHERQKQCKKTAREVCASLLHTYLYIFTDEYNEIPAKAYEHIYYFIDITVKRRGREIYVEPDTTFPQFLEIFQFAVEQIIFRWKEKNDRNRGQEYADVNSRIVQVVAEKQKERIISGKNKESPTGAVLYLYDQLYGTSCYRNDHLVVPRRYVADLVNQSGQIVLPVHFCAFCNKFFIGKRTLALFVKTYGKMIMEARQENGDTNSFDDFGHESKLHQLGYNVVKGKMTEEERHAILIYLVKNERISYMEVCASIEHNIHVLENSLRHQLAVTKWKNDLEFIGQWVIDNPAYK